MLCPACKTPVPLSESQCPACGTATPVDAAETQIDVKNINDDVTLDDVQPGGWSKPFTTSDTKSLVPGSILGGRYKILKMLGEGGMGSVFKAHDEEVDRIVA